MKEERGKGEEKIWKWEEETTGRVKTVLRVWTIQTLQSRVIGKNNDVPILDIARMASLWSDYQYSHQVG